MECMKFKYIGKCALLGFADLCVVELDMDIYGCTVFQKDGKRWMSFPAREVEVEGGKKFFPHIRFRKKDMMDRFVAEAMNALKPEIDKALTVPKREDDIDQYFP